MEPSELLKRLTDAIAPKPDVVPDGYRTIAQWAKFLEIHPQKADKLIKEAYHLKKMERRKYRIATDSRGTYPTWHYAFKEEDEK